MFLVNILYILIKVVCRENVYINDVHEANRCTTEFLKNSKKNIFDAANIFVSKTVLLENLLFISHNFQFDEQAYN